MPFVYPPMHREMVEVFDHPAQRTHSTASVVRKWVRKGKAVYLDEARTKARFLGHRNRIIGPMSCKVGYLPADANWNGEDLPTDPRAALREARYTAERRDRERNAIGCHSQTEWEQILAAFDNKCLRCGIRAQDTYYGKLTKDHVVPLIKGGTDFASNLQPLCLRCNSWKHDREIDFRSTWKETRSSGTA